MPVEPKRCLACCQRFRRTRGLCGRCYDRLGHAVRRGETTWAQLETDGRVLRAGPKGGPSWRPSRLSPKQGP
jgi:hypothetical protein